MAFGWQKRPLGRTGLMVSPIGLGSSFGISCADVERAFDRGINYLYWGSLRRPSFGRGIRNIARRNRDELVTVVQTYSRARLAIAPSVELALRTLSIDYTDILLLGWWNHEPPERILDGALALVEAGKARHIMISCHNRPMFERFINDPIYGGIMVRYNAAHTGAEREVFPHVAAHSAPPGVCAYTATRWGALLDRRMIPEGEPVPRASDCYRFVLSNPHVDMCLSGPKNAEELDEAMAALDRGPLDEEEMAWMRRVGEAVHSASAAKSVTRPAHLLDRFANAVLPRRMQ